jgi:hypothetical protein
MYTVENVLRKESGYANKSGRAQHNMYICLQSRFFAIFKSLLVLLYLWVNRLVTDY